METLEKYPSQLLLSGLFLIAILAHVWMCSTIQPVVQPRIVTAEKKTLHMNFRNTWKPPIRKVTAQPAKKRPAPDKPKTDPQKTAPSAIPDPVKTVRQVEPPDKPLPLPEKKQVLLEQSKPDTPATADTSLIEPLPDKKVAQAGTTPEQPENRAPTESIQPPAAKQTQRANFDWNTLIHQFLNQLDINDYYPVSARRRRQQGIVIVRVTLLKSATLEAVAIDRPSRFVNLNKAALDLIRTNRTALETILAASNINIEKPIQLRLPIRFALR